MVLNKRIIPCLDIAKGRVVKGTNFINLKDAGDPLEIAQRYNEEGADEIAFLDINASIENRNLLLKMIKNVASKIFIPFSVGGGINSINDVNDLLNHGADKVSINTSAIKNPLIIKEVINKYGSQCLILAIDVKRKKYKNYFSWEVYTHGGRFQTGLDIFQWCKIIYKLKIGEILITSIDKDGTYNGFDLELTFNINKIINIPIITSGGAGNINDLINGIKYGKADALLAASIFHYNIYSILEIKRLFNKNNIPVRI